MKRVETLKTLLKIVLVMPSLLSVLSLSGCVGPANDLMVEMTVSGPVAVGEELTYNIQTTSIGPNVAEGYSLNLTFSRPVNFVSTSIPLGSCSQTNGTINCETGFTSPRDSISIRVVALAQGNLEATATVTPWGFETRPEDNSVTVATTIIDRFPGLHETITDSPDPVVVGHDLTYTIALDNDSTDIISGLELINTLPESVTLVSALDPSCTQVGRTLNCHPPTIENGFSWTYEFIVRPSAGGNIQNSVLIVGHSFSTISTTVVPVADLSVTINPLIGPALVGEILTYSIKITNSSPIIGNDMSGVVREAASTTTDASLTVRPTPVSQIATATFVFASVPEGSTFDCRLSAEGFAACSGSIAFNPLDPQCPNCATVTLGVRLNQVGSLVTTAIVSTTAIDPNPLNNSSTLTTQVVPKEADLLVSVIDSPDPVTPEGFLTYRITVTNNGPASATGVSLLHILPAGALLVSSEPMGVCIADSPFVGCSLGSMAAGSSATVVLVVIPTIPGVASFEARVSAGEPDPISSNNTAIEYTGIGSPLLPDLSVSVVDTPDPVVVNQQLTYNITVRNNGFGEANGFELSATLQPSVMATTNNGFICSINSDGNPVCRSTGVRLPRNAEASYTLVVTPTAAGMIANTVNLTLSQTDTNPADNSVTVNTLVSAPAPTADIAVVVSDSPDPVAVNQSLTYTTRITNNGLATATNIVATLTLPSSLTVQSPLVFCSLLNGSRVCQLSAPFSLPNGQSQVFTLAVTPTAAATVTVTGNVNATETDPNTTNNSDDETTEIVPPPATADLEVVSVSDSPDPVLVNDQFTYTMTIRNNGLSEATGVIVTNTLSAGVVSDGGPSCAAGNGPVIQCSLGNMSSGSSQTIFFRARGSLTGSVSNIVSVTGQEMDPDLSNNTKTENTLIVSANTADLSVNITAQPNPVQLPSNVTVTLIVQNTGPATANAVVLTGFDVRMFQVPETLNIVTTQGSCSLVTSFPNLRCDIGALANNSSATVTITGRPLVGTFMRTVSAATSSNDPNPNNNSANLTVTVNP
jgi:uncharacterized repeat protein (TIGR01451 family)